MDKHEIVININDKNSMENFFDTMFHKGKQGRPPKAEHEKLRGYRYNLNLDRDLKEYLHEVAWKKRTSITQYINDLIRADMQRGGE